MALGDTHAGGGVGTGEWAQGAGANWSGYGDFGSVSNPGYSGGWGNTNASQPNAFNGVMNFVGQGQPASWFGNPAYFGYQVDPLTGQTYNTYAQPQGSPDPYNATNFAGGGQGDGQTGVPGYAGGGGGGGGGVQPGYTAPLPQAPAPAPINFGAGAPAVSHAAPGWDLNLTQFAAYDPVVAPGGGGALSAPAPWTPPPGLLGSG